MAVTPFIEDLHEALVRARKGNNVNSKSEKPFRKVAIVGSGYMGGGMAQCFVLEGYECVIADATAEIAESSRERLIEEARAYEAEGLFEPGSADTIEKGLRAAGSIEDAVKDADYIAEVVSEKLTVKEDVLSRISEAALPTAVITSNTSAIPIGTLAEFVTHPDRFLGAHWMNPAPFVPCVEIIPIEATSDAAIVAVERLLESVGKVTTRVSDVAGFVANRLQFALFQESMRMVDEGVATSDVIDEVVSNSFGFRLPFFGPFAGADMAGLDVYVGAYESLSKAYGERYTVPQSLLDRVSAGKLGLKSGGGFTKVAAGNKDEVAAYRNRAYFALMKLRDELGPRPGSGQ
jgi:3-hydroxybutyryl-CoA dehydrogenase